MKKRMLPVLLILLVFLLWIPAIVSAADNLSIQLDEHLPVTVQPGETISISVDLRNNPSYTWEDCVIILENSFGLEIESCEGAATYGNTGSKCYVQFKGLPIATIYIHNRSNEEARSGTIWFSEVTPVESFSIDNAPDGWGDGWCGRVVGGDTYFGDYKFNNDYFWLEPTFSPANHEDCYVVEWASSNTGVATVDGGGRIQKRKAGETTISATLSNGMTAKYNLVIVEPEILYPGYQKTLTISPGEQCDFLFDVIEGGKYSVYIPYFDELYESVSFGYDASHECVFDSYNGYAIFTFDLSTELSPLCCSLEYPVVYDNGSLIDAEPITITIYFNATSSTKNPFLDVPAGIWYEKPVLWALENGVTTGTSDTTFSPGDKCLRAHVVTFLWNAEECPAPAAAASTFTDVPAGAWYEKPVLWAVENGITSGTSATKFGAGDVCSRYQVVFFLWKAAGSPEPKTTVNPFTDVNPGHFFYKAVLWAVENGITSGTSDTTFSPAQPCNRAQVVTFLYAAYN